MSSSPGQRTKRSYTMRHGQKLNKTKQWKTHQSSWRLDEKSTGRWTGIGTPILSNVMLLKERGGHSRQEGARLPLDPTGPPSHGWQKHSPVATSRPLSPVLSSFISFFPQDFITFAQSMYFVLIMLLFLACLRQVDGSFTRAGDCVVH